jgi:ParB-like chromosome segregation protein Spo0J
MIIFRMPKVVDLQLLEPNSYNPNKMPKKEMNLLANSIKKYGFLFPILCNYENNKYVIIDGYHRYETLKRLQSKEALIVDLELTMNERMQLTILMNRIKGMHKVDSMANIIYQLTNLGMSEIEIAKNLGMEADELIRLQQQLGIATHYQHHQFSKSWEHNG